MLPWKLLRWESCHDVFLPCSHRDEEIHDCTVMAVCCLGVCRLFRIHTLLGRVAMTTTPLDLSACFRRATASRRRASVNGQSAIAGLGLRLKYEPKHLSDGKGHGNSIRVRESMELRCGRRDWKLTKFLGLRCHQGTGRRARPLFFPIPTLGPCPLHHFPTTSSYQKRQTGRN
jgi:hypothetical protein